MFYSNDDLDNLSKKAAEDYPLKTDNSNWDDVAARLNKSSESLSSKSIKILKYTMIILLAGGSLILYKHQTASDFEQNERKKNNKKVIAGSTQKKSPSSSADIIKPAINSQLTNPVQFDIEKSNSSRSVYVFNSTPVNAFGSVSSVKERQSLYLNNETLLNSEKSLLKLPSSHTQENQGLNYSHNETDELGNSDNNMLAEVPKDENKSIETGDQRIILTQNHNYKIYGTLFGGPEFSTVKFQRLDKPGYKIGVSLGYRINKNLSVEIGLQREHLNFYSSGDYLDTSMLRIKPNTNIEDVTVSSKLTSVPVSLRYNFPSKSKGRFYTSAGINALIITHSEKYNYSVSKDGVPANMHRSYSALTGPKYFSGVNLTAGYEKDLSKCWSLKVESYYQTPINNLGVGKLPVTSFGVNVGISKNLK